MRIKSYSFEYVCVVCCLKIRFYCLNFSVMSNLNSADFTTPNQSSDILIRKIEMVLEFQNKTNIEIIGFQLMHFGFALELSDIDLWNIDFLDTHLDLLDTNIPSKYFLFLHEDVLSVTLLHLQRNIPWKTSSRRLGRLKIFTLVTCWTRIQDPQMFGGTSMQRKVKY